MDSSDLKSVLAYTFLVLVFLLVWLGINKFWVDAWPGWGLLIIALIGLGFLELFRGRAEGLLQWLLKPLIVLYALTALGGLVKQIDERLWISLHEYFTFRAWSFAADLQSDTDLVLMNKLYNAIEKISDAEREKFIIELEKAVQKGKFDPVLFDKVKAFADSIGGYRKTYSVNEGKPAYERLRETSVFGLFMFLGIVLSIVGIVAGIKTRSEYFVPLWVIGLVFIGIALVILFVAPRELTIKNVLGDDFSERKWVEVRMPEKPPETPSTSPTLTTKKKNPPSSFTPTYQKQHGTFLGYLTLNPQGVYVPKEFTDNYFIKWEPETPSTKYFIHRVRVKSILPGQKAEVEILDWDEAKKLWGEFDPRFDRIRFAGPAGVLMSIYEDGKRRVNIMNASQARSTQHDTTFVLIKIKKLKEGQKFDELELKYLPRDTEFIRSMQLPENLGINDSNLNVADVMLYGWGIPLLSSLDGQKLIYELPKGFETAKVAFLAGIVK